MNAIVRANPGYDLYGMLPDDSVLLVPGWDKAMFDTAKGFPGYVGVVDVQHEGRIEDGGVWWTDTPFVTSEWIKRVGWFACPRFSHWCWPIITGAIGAATTMVRLPADKMNVHHHRDWNNAQTSEESERQSLWPFLVEDFPRILARLKAA